MKRLIVFFVFLSVLCTTGCGTTSKNTNSSGNVVKKASAQTAKKNETYNGWQYFSLKGMGEFLIPPTMELQSKNYRNVVKKAVDASGNKSKDLDDLYNHSLEGSRVVFQQKGLNAAATELKQYGPGHQSAASKEAYSKYVRIAINIKNVEDVPELGKPLGLTTADLKEFKESVIGEFFKGPSNDPIRPSLISCDEAVIKKINGNECVYLKYVTRLKTNPNVNNEEYMFFNKNKIYTFTIMYRSTQADIWTAPGKDVRDFIKTVKFY